MIDFTVPGHPVPQPRPRTFVRGGKPITVSRPSGSRIESWCETVATVAAGHRPAHPMDGRLQLVLLLDFPRLASGRLRAATGDLDNYAKPILDVLTRLDFWGDDSQVDELHVVRRHADAGDPGGARVLIGKARVW